MKTEITEYENNAAYRGTIFYDAECALCVEGRHLAGGIFGSRGFLWRPMQAPGSAASLGVSESVLVRRMHLREADGRVTDGAGALGVLCRSVWWLWPLGVILAVPGFRDAGRALYEWAARNRHCLGGSCVIGQKRFVGPEWFINALLMAVPAGVATATWNLEPWVFMWSMALALGMIGKWLTWRDAVHHDALPTLGRVIGWFVAWPGLDGRAFLGVSRTELRPRQGWGESAVAVLKIAFGVVLIWFIHPRLEAHQALIAGWVGMIGIVFLLHFGLVHFMSVAWRAAGVDARPIMRWPVGATSLADFWGSRWNTAFSIPARRLLFRPALPVLGPEWAGFAVFVASGLLHELVISMPARSGWGLPTLFFLAQGLAIQFERSRVGRRMGLGRGLRGWAFVVLLAAGPAFWLFHPLFVERVMLPFLHFLTNH